VNAIERRSSHEGEAYSVGQGIPEHETRAGHGRKHLECLLRIPRAPDDVPGSDQKLLDRMTQFLVVLDHEHGKPHDAECKRAPEPVSGPHGDLPA